MTGPRLSDGDHGRHAGERLAGTPGNRQAAGRGVAHAARSRALRDLQF